jgi:hypothetical protein
VPAAQLHELVGDREGAWREVGPPVRMPTSTNHGNAYSEPFQRSAATAAGKN